ncbi:MAG: LamG domain-containing protein [Bacteroidales bacterium]
MNRYKLSVIIIILSSLFQVSLIRAQEIQLEDLLVARYLFEENARNSVEDKNHGLETNVQYATDRFGQTNHCLYLSGEHSYVTIPHTEDLNWDARTESYSICFWVKSIDPRQGKNVGIRVISKWYELVSDPYPFSFPVGDTLINAQIREANTEPLACTINGIWDDQWHHIAMVFNHESGEMSLYYDGLIYKTSRRTFRTTTENSIDICIGRTLRLDVYYRGHIDDLYFYNRAISPCEIDALFTGDLLEER